MSHRIPITLLAFDRLEHLLFVLPYCAVFAFLLLALTWQERHIHGADRFLLYLFPITYMVETLQLIRGSYNINNLRVYHIYAVFELFLYACYFNRVIPFLGKRNLGIWIGCTGLVIELILNGPLAKIFPVNSTFSEAILYTYESVVLIFFCILSYYSLFTQAIDYPVFKNVQFWISSLILLFNSLTLLYWGLSPIVKRFYVLFEYAGVLYYAGLAIVFMRYKKLIPSGRID